MKVLTFICERMPEHLRAIMVMNVLAAVGMVALLTIVETASSNVAEGAGDPRLIFMFLAATALIGVTHTYVLTTSSYDAERMVNAKRRHLFDLARRADLVTIEQIGRGALHAVLIEETQALARMLPMLAIGAQQAVMLAFIGLYLAWLSLPAFLIAAACCAIALALRLSRAASLRRNLQRAAEAEAQVYDGLTDMLRGFKEVRMDHRRAEGLVGDLERGSNAARGANADLKRQWGADFALIESLFFILIGVMVFVVPLFTTGYHTVVVPATTAALFLIGPIGTVSYVAPMMTQAERALTAIEAMERRLEKAAGPAPEASARQSFPAAFNEIALDGAGFTRRDDHGEAIFRLKDLSAAFEMGTITFITGGNGSGKTTMLRLLTGLLPLEEGAVLIDGEAVAADAMQAYRDRISAIFSDHHLSRRIYGLSDAKQAIVGEWLKRLKMNKKVQINDGAFSTVDLSTGQRKRLALAVALAEDRPILVLDEWAADQDPEFRKEFYENILPSIKKPNRIIICVTHDDHWFHLADRRYHLKEGKIALITQRPELLG